MLDARVLVYAFLTSKGMRNKRPRPTWRGVFVLYRSEKIFEKTGRVLLAFQECHVESEVGDALEPLRSDEASSRVLQAPVGPFLPKGPNDECLFQAVGTLWTCVRAVLKGSMRTAWET
jgi:hypothetical protein